MPRPFFIMATPTLYNVPTTISVADATTNWVGTSLDVDPDLKKEGSNAVFGILRSDLATIYFDDSTIRSMDGEHFRGWMLFAAVANLDSEANGGMEVFMSDGTNTAYWTVFGNDTYFGGWKNVVLDPSRTPDAGTAPTLANVNQWGFRFNRTSAPANKDNTWVDYFRYGDGYFITAGTTGDRVSLADVFAIDNSSGYGIVEETEGVYFSYGKLTIGSGTAATAFSMENEILVYTDSLVATGLYEFRGTGVADIYCDNCVFRAAGTGGNTRFIVDMSYTGLSGVELTNNLFARASTSNFASGWTVANNTFNDCDQITTRANMSGSKVAAYEGPASGAALIYNGTTEPSGLLKNMTFEKGTGLNHAIEFGTGTPATITIDGMTSIGYNSANATGDATFYVAKTTGTQTINVINGGGNFSYRSAGATVDIVIDPVSTTVKVLDGRDNSNLQSARVIVKASSNAGELPYDETVTITRSGSTASVSHTAHGMKNGDKVQIRGANEQEYNGVFIISNVTTDAYDYTVTGTPDTPATGTIKATGVVLEGTTDVNGEISSSRTWTLAQPIEGRVRKASGSPYFKQGKIAGTISTTAGYSATVALVIDE
jgi:hypothetical protein